MVFVEKVLLLFSLIMGQHGTYSRSPQTGAAEHNRNYQKNLFLVTIRGTLYFIRLRKLNFYLSTFIKANFESGSMLPTCMWKSV